MIALAAACLALGALRPVYIGEDARYTLAWGDQIAQLERPELDGPVPAAHPLLLGAGAVLAPLGSSAAIAVVEGLAVASFALLGFAAYRLTAAIGGRWAGMLAAAIVLSRPETIDQLLNTNKDILFAALVLLAGSIAIAESTRRPLPVLVLLAVAGLIRPEAWLLAALYWLWLYRAGPARAVAPAPLALLVAPPLLWAGIDAALTGDPLHALHHARNKSAEVAAAGLAVPGGGGGGSSEITRLGRGLDHGIVEQVGWTAIVAAVIVAAAQIRAGLRAGRRGLGAAGILAVPVAIVVATLAAATVAALAGLAVPGRFLLVAALVIACVAAAPLRGVRVSAAAAAAIALLVLGAVITLPGTVDDWRDAGAQRADARRQADRLEGLLERPAVRRAVAACPLGAFAGDNFGRVSLGRSVAALHEGVGIAELAVGGRPRALPASGRSALGWGPASIRGTAATERTAGRWQFASDC